MLTQTSADGVSILVLEVAIIVPKIIPLGGRVIVSHVLVMIGIDAVLIELLKEIQNNV